MKNKQYSLEQIYESAFSVFAKFGYKKTSMRDIAGELGMTQGNIYLYVKNKRDLYEKSVLHAIFKFEKYMVDALQRENDVVMQIIAMSEAGFEYIAKDGDLRSILINDRDLLLRPQEESFSAENLQQYMQVHEFGKTMLIRSLKKGISEKRFREFNVDYISELLAQIYMMFIKRIFFMPEMISVREMTKEIVNLVLYGIVNKSSENHLNITYKGYGEI
ncbi:MAG: TetR/AcrR family transcriptional regulator [Desulfobacterales bacterium]